MNTMAVINIAKGQLGMDEDTYRAALKRVTGKTSLRAMTYQQREAVVADFERMGFKRRRPGGRGTSKKGYVRLIFALWKSCAEKGVIQDGSRAALRTFVGNQTERSGQRIDDPDFLNYGQASPIIETLKSMEARG